MSKVRVPLLENHLLRNTSKIFLGIGSFLTKLFPNLKAAIEQSGIKDAYDIDAREYMAFVFFVFIAAFVGLGGLLTAILVQGEAEYPVIGAGIGFLTGAMASASMLLMPVNIVNKRVKLVERNLLFSLRSLLIQIRSGVPLFSAITSIAVGNYGAISDEFKVVVEKVNSGMPTEDVLEELAERNPSLYFRRALWQIVNSKKSGSDLGKNLQDMLKSLAKEQMVEISRYKSILNPLAMMYMMVAVIAPSLGITMLIILSFFPNMEVLSDEKIFWGLLAGVVVMQFIFMGLIKSKRPNLIGG